MVMTLVCPAEQAAVVFDGGLASLSLSATRHQLTLRGESLRLRERRQPLFMLLDLLLSEEGERLVNVDVIARVENRRRGVEGEGLEGRRWPLVGGLRGCVGRRVRERS